MTPGLAPEVYARLLHDEQGRPLGYVPAPAGEIRMGVGAPSVLLLRYAGAGLGAVPAGLSPAAPTPATLRRREAS